MATLHQLLDALPSWLDVTVENRRENLEITSVTADSREVQSGSVFVALKGSVADGHAYIRQSAAAGSPCVVVEDDPGPLPGVTVVKVNDTHAALGILAATLQGLPAKSLTMIGLTGTNGKTTVSWVVEQMLTSCGFRVGVIGTIHYRYPDSSGRQVVVRASLTTPDPVQLQQLLRAMVDQGVTHVVMETSSHALVQKRLQGIVFDAAVFTNLSRDHLDFHVDMEQYFAAKKLLFTANLKQGGRAVVVTDPGEQQTNWGERLVAELAENGNTAAPITCGLSGENTVHADQLQLDLGGFSCRLDLDGSKQEICSELAGRYNVLNVLAAAGVGLGLGLQSEQIARGLARLNQVPGRLQRVQLPGAAASAQPAVFVDYAHTPDALRNVLQTLRNLAEGRIICVFGCGGDRDRGKRPLMAEVAAELADLSLVTSDNPRSEDPGAIISEVAAGFVPAGITEISEQELFSRTGGKAFSCIPDRTTAIHAACILARPEDIVLIAGKGHEDYQLLAGNRIFFDDRLCALDGLLSWSTDHLILATRGRLCSGRQQSLPGKVSTDTRTLEPGDIFIALAGENFDGHEYVETAVRAGAAAVIVHREVADVPDHVLLIRVQDTQQALGDLAGYRRRLLQGSLPVAAVTGSSGKTTVKEMTAAIFHKHLAGVETGRDPLLKTAGNFNNLIGLPLSLLPIAAGHRMALLEMGMNRPGEIERLTAITDPDIGCINNVQAAHLEGLGSIQGVARAKGELFAGMRPDTVAVVNYDDPLVRKLPRVSKTVVGFAVTPAGRRFKPAVRATRVVNMGEQGMRFTLHVAGWQRRISVPAPGQHNVSNCAASAAISHAAGVAPETIAEALTGYQSVDKRMQFIDLPGGVHVLNDCYNANPASMAAALKTVSGFGSGCRRIALLGDMLELGHDAVAAHAEIGRQTAALGYDELYVLGSFGEHVVRGAVAGGMAEVHVHLCTVREEIADQLYTKMVQGQIIAGDWLLVKGSRGMRMEEILQELTHRFTTGIEELG